MDDLTRLKGIGKAAAKILADAGLTTFAAVAAAERPEGLAASVDWAAVVAEAAGLAGDPDAPAGPSLTITGPRRGRWRGGRHFGPQPVTIPLADLTGDEIAALRADPALTVEETV
ncbi:hypothetical protein [Pannonibacter indicus]|uniref:hypothetical protein n=1 Tax=Pannonibacter indicus TaxID=466044 RepID=UPI00391CC883